MITIKISELLDSTDTLQKLARTELKAKPAYWVGRLIKAADAEIQTFNETRLNLIKKYGEKDDNGELVTDEKGNCTIDKDSVKDFTNELNELLATEIQINANKISLDVLEGNDFTPGEMTVLEPFVDIE